MGSLIGGVLQAWRFAVGYIDDRRRTNAVKRELWELGPDELGAILNDLGLTSQDFHEAMRLPYAWQDMSTAAMESLGLDRATFHARHEAWHRDIQRTCMMCPHHRRCVRELATGGFASSHRQFCPNAENFDDLISNPEAGVCMKSTA